MNEKSRGVFELRDPQRFIQYRAVPDVPRPVHSASAAPIASNGDGACGRPLPWPRPTHPRPELVRALAPST
jgi:hypothetical protein